MAGPVQLTVAAAAWRFASPEVLLLLVLVPPLALGVWASFARQRRALSVFAGATPQESRPSAARALVRIALLAGGAASLMVAIARPQADPVEEDSTVRGRDIVFLVDVSRSMLSRDVVPNRLERAKLWIKDLTKTLRGDRVGLVAFAGVPVIQSPLTLDYGYFRMALDELSPGSSPRGGTLIGDAIRKTLADVFEPGVGRYRDIILITDGEDQGSFPVEAAKQAGERGVRIIAIGIGSELEGAPVPAKEGNTQNFVEYEGQPVRSRLDSSTLAQITAAAAQARGDAAGGVFLNVGTGTIELDRVYHDLIASAQQRETQKQAAVVYRELFPAFLVLSLICLAAEPLIPIRIRSRRSLCVSIPRSVPATLLVAMAAATIVRADPPASEPAKPAAAAAPDAATSYNTGRDLFLAGKFAEAGDAFRRADLGATDPELSARARFNLGQALLKQASAGSKSDPSQTVLQLDEAARAFRGVLAVNPKDAEAARNVELARRLMKDAQRQQSEQQQGGQGGDKPKDQAQQDQHKQDQSGDQSQGGNDKKDANKDSQQHKDNAEAMKDLAQRQSKAADKSRDAQQQQDQPGKDAKAQESKSDQAAVNKDTQQERQRLDSSKSASQQAQERLDQAQKEQQAASQALDQGDTRSAEEHQRKAADLLGQAAQAEQSAAQVKQQADQPKEPKHDETAAQLLDKERKQREARQQILRALKGRAQPVEKDW